MTRARRILTSLVALATTVTITAVSTASPASAASTSLSGYWPMDEGGGQYAYDWSFSGNRGYLGSTTGADAADPSWVQLPWFLIFRQSALRFSGAQRVTVPNAPTLEPDGVTVALRVRSTGPGSFRYLASKGALTCETASYGLYTGRDGGLVFYVSDGTSYTLSADAGTGVWDGAWHTVAGAYDGTSVRLWVDGRLVGSPVPANVRIGYGLPDGKDFLIGDYAGSCGSPLGFVGDVDGAALLGTYNGSGSIL